MIQMYYDEYEKDYGDGFYPSLLLLNQNMKCISIEFEYNHEKQVWVQKTEDMIQGLDGSCGKELLQWLNEKGKVKGLGIYSYCSKSNYGTLLISENENRYFSPIYKRPTISGASSSGFSTISPLKKC